MMERIVWDAGPKLETTILTRSKKTYSFECLFDRLSFLSTPFTGARVGGASPMYRACARTGSLRSVRPDIPYQENQHKLSNMRPPRTYLALDRYTIQSCTHILCKNTIILWTSNGQAVCQLFNRCFLHWHVVHSGFFTRRYSLCHELGTISAFVQYNTYHICYDPTFD